MSTKEKEIPGFHTSNETQDNAPSHQQENPITPPQASAAIRRGTKRKIDIALEVLATDEEAGIQLLLKQTQSSHNKSAIETGRLLYYAEDEQLRKRFLEILPTKCNFHLRICFLEILMQDNQLEIATNVAMSIISIWIAAKPILELIKYLFELHDEAINKKIIKFSQQIYWGSNSIYHIPEKTVDFLKNLLKLHDEAIHQQVMDIVLKSHNPFTEIEIAKYFIAEEDPSTAMKVLYNSPENYSDQERQAVIEIHLALYGGHCVQKIIAEIFPRIEGIGIQLIVAGKLLPHATDAEKAQIKTAIFPILSVKRLDGAIEAAELILEPGICESNRRIYEIVAEREQGKKPRRHDVLPENCTREEIIERLKITKPKRHYYSYTSFDEQTEQPIQLQVEKPQTQTSISENFDQREVIKQPTDAQSISSYWPTSFAQEDEELVQLPEEKPKNENGVANTSAITEPKNSNEPALDVFVAKKLAAINAESPSEKDIETLKHISQKAKNPAHRKQALEILQKFNAAPLEEKIAKIIKTGLPPELEKFVKISLLPPKSQLETLKTFTDELRQKCEVELRILLDVLSQVEGANLSIVFIGGIGSKKGYKGMDATVENIQFLRKKWGIK